MSQSLSPDAMRLLEQLQAAIGSAEHAAILREAQITSLDGTPAATDRSEPATAARSPGSSLALLDRACHHADRLTANAETEMVEIEAALQHWLAAVESWSGRLDSVVNQIRPSNNPPLPATNGNRADATTV